MIETKRAEPTVVYDSSQADGDWSDHTDHAPIGNVVGEYGRRVRLTAVREVCYTYEPSGQYFNGETQLVEYGDDILTEIHYSPERLVIEVSDGEDRRGETRWKEPQTKDEYRDAMTVLARYIQGLRTKREWTE